ncbi:GH32 C-terminal domain-containing protein [Microbacterium sp. BK668]|uniref:OmpL47-type beta-barrel domain-containing protein n=1 Tax=Microbacterium sp. BK668 TaxID=2512118 RepID=UPI00106202B4|nr:GH32 C-terminal domain-containing protein [Microbacterium sp. BK668]TDN91480.1 sucrose-6-phosphate hydrolase SacC (GH32 family) [Microbacterium sp. BK668]
MTTRAGRLGAIAAAAAAALVAATLIAVPSAAQAADTTIANPSFESGDLTGWTSVEGDAFTDANVSDATDWGWGCCFNPDGTYHLWGAAAGGDAPTGVLRSSEFTLGGIGEVSFLIGGGNDIDNLYVSLHRASDGAEIRRATNTAFADSERLTRVVWDLAAEIGETLYLEVVDKASGGWGHINVDDFRTFTEQSIAEIRNPGFETGDLSGWTTAGEAFSDAHVSDATDWGWGGPFNHDGTYHLWGAATGGDAPTGTLRSSTFTLTGTGTIEFLIGGGNDRDNLYVALHRASDGAELMRATNTGFADSESYSLVRWDASAQLGQDLYFEVVDNATGGWGHINVDAFDTTVEVIGYELANPGFESGTLEGWTPTGDAFSSEHVTEADTTPGGESFGQEGSFHLWGGALQDDAAVGTLESSRFRIGGQGRIELLAGGTADAGIYIAIVSEDGGTEIARTSLEMAGEPYNALSLDVTEHRGETVRLRLVDESTTGHLNVDGIRTLVNEPMHWKFDETSGAVADGGAADADRVAYVFNDAAFKPDSDPLWTKGVAGGALLFDGYSTYIERAPAESLTPSGTLSISAWVAPRSYEWGDLGQASAIVNQHDVKAKTGYLLGMYRHGAWGLELGDGVDWHTIRADGDAVLPTYEWSHVAATYDAASGFMRLYLNGDLVAEENIGEGTRILPAVNQPLLIGRHNNAAVINGTFRANMWNGAIDELTVTDAAWDAEDVAAAADPGGELSAPDIQPDRARLDGDRYRPQYHFLPAEHWMNEPHAPVYYDGKYHIFYQHNPQGPYWHQIHWGHAVSDDMVHWEDLPEAISPTPPVTPDGVWSGSATLDADGKPVLFYTAGNDAAVPNQATGLAWPADAEDSDLTDWILEPEPVTVQAPDLDSPVGQPWFGQFRDPFVWKETADDGKPIWYQIVGSGIVDGATRVGGTALLYTSRDLVNWEYHNPLFIGDAVKYPKTGQVWELPVLLPVGSVDGVEKHVLVINPWFDGYNPNTAKNTYYWVGEWDRESLTFIPDHDEPRMWDYGEHFTGPSGMVDPDGRSILFTITQDGRSEGDHYQAGWAHSMGLPVSLGLLPGGDVGIQPIEELTSLRGDKVVDVKNQTVAKTNAMLDTKHDAFTDLLEIDLELQLAPGQSVAGLEVRRSADGTERTSLTVDRSAGTIGIDRTFSSLDPDTRKGVHEGAFEVGPNGKVSIHTYIDRSVVEAYVGGAKSLTSRIYPTRADAVGVRIVGDDTVKVKSLKIWNLEGAFGEVVPSHFDAPRPEAAEGLPNGDFATCDLSGWTVVDGDAFTDATVTDRDDWGWGGPFRQANSWGSGDRCHLWGFDESVGDATTGAIRSTTFTLGGDGIIDLLTAGGYDPDKLYVAAVRASDGTVLAKVTGNEQEGLRAQYQRKRLDLSAHVGEELYLEIVDRATGGWGHISVDDVNAPAEPEDATPPTVGVEPEPNSPDGRDGWYVGEISVAATARDDLDSAPTIEVSIDGAEYTPYAEPVTFAADGEHSLSARATDRAGNTSRVVEWAGKLDRTPPDVAATSTATPRQVTLTATDPTSGVAAIEYAIIAKPGQQPKEWTPYSAPIDVGKNKVRVAYRAVDVAGNISATKEHEVAIATPTKTTVRIDLERHFVKRGGEVQLTVAVRAGDGSAPLGEIVLTDNGRPSIRRALTSDDRGAVVLTLAGLKRGLHVYEVTFTGDGYARSSSTRTLVVAF